MSDLRKELIELLNSYNTEMVSNTPDFILTEYLLMCLASFDYAIQQRDKWYDVHLEPGNTYFNKDER